MSVRVEKMIEGEDVESAEYGVEECECGGGNER
jgi:hypothetical protein